MLKCSVWSFACCMLSCGQLCDPTDCSLLGSSVHEVLQARILQRVVISYSRGSSQPRNRTRLLQLLHQQADSLPLNHLEDSLSIICTNKQIQAKRLMCVFVCICGYINTHTEEKQIWQNINW